MSKARVRKLHLFIDMDEVTADLMNPWLTWVNTTFNLNHKYTDVKGWEIHRFVECGKQCYDFLAEEGVYSALDPIPGAVKALNALQVAGHKITFVTAPPSNHEHAKEEKIKWLEKRFKWFNAETDILFSHDKGHDGLIHKADILLDDRAKWLYDFQGISIAFDRPWNQHFNGLRIRTWPEFVKKVNAMARLDEQVLV